MDFKGKNIYIETKPRYRQSDRDLIFDIRKYKRRTDSDLLRMGTMSYTKEEVKDFRDKSYRFFLKKVFFDIHDFDRKKWNDLCDNGVRFWLEIEKDVYLTQKIKKEIVLGITI